MTMREVIRELTSQGHRVTYYVRKDGGVLIRSIDGQMFTGATGNMYARAMSGKQLSVKRAKQLSTITWSGKRAKSQLQDKEVKKALEKVQRKWRKAFPKVDGKVPSVGRKTAKKVKWSLEHKGKEETMRLLSEAERYASGKAYTKNIELLATFIEKAAGDYESKELEDLAEYIRQNAWKIDEDSIQPAYDELYKLNKGISPQEVAKNTKKILFPIGG